VPPEWIGQRVRLRVDAARRAAHSRYHTVLHVLNTIAQRDYGAWITGAQIGVDYSRIDFQWDGFSPALCGALEQKVNAVLAEDRTLAAYSLDEAEFSRRPDLLRTLEVKPPVVDGQVRVVEIEGFDAQACGGTHVHSTAELGRFEITRTENKGRINKRLYVHLREA
jgi:misacylated tRNA(Ala) deacylase